MKVTVCFEGVCVIVPCGNGDLTVRDLIQRSISRYRKATNKPADEFIQVNFLETSDDHGILDPDDLLCDVVDDKEKLVAIFEEGSTVHQVTQNGGCRTRDSSTGTASPATAKIPKKVFLHSIQENSWTLTNKLTHKDVNPCRTGNTTHVIRSNTTTGN